MSYTVKIKVEQAPQFEFIPKPPFLMVESIHASREPSNRVLIRIGRTSLEVIAHDLICAIQSASKP